MVVGYTNIHAAAEKTMTIAAESPSVVSAAASVARSPWHSPVPYLFGGLAAMLGLIAFALLILACSYWKLSGNLEGGSERDLEAGEGNGNGGDDGDDLKKAKPVFQANFAVIMPGFTKPTCLATPMSSRASSFGSSTSTGTSSSACSTNSSTNNSSGTDEKKDEESHDLSQVEMGSMGGHGHPVENTTNQDNHQVS